MEKWGRKHFLILFFQKKKKRTRSSQENEKIVIFISVKFIEQQNSFPCYHLNGIYSSNNVSHLALTTCLFRQSNSKWQDKNVKRVIIYLRVIKREAKKWRNLKNNNEEVRKMKKTDIFCSSRMEWNFRNARFKANKMKSHHFSYVIRFTFILAATSLWKAKFDFNSWVHECFLWNYLEIILILNSLYSNVQITTKTRSIGFQLNR